MMKKITLLSILLISSFGYSQSLPLDFETATTWADFDGGVVTTESNPFSDTDNNSAQVGKMVKSAGQVWGGSSLVLSSALDFTANNTFSMKVYATKANAKVLLKVENSADANIKYEKEVTMTSTNAWETLTFDYSAIPANTYDKVVIIFDLGTMGDGTADFTYHFDDITLYEETVSGPTVNLPIDFETATTWGDFDGGAVTTEANPFSNGDNNSAMVGKMIKSAGQVWGGSSLILSTPMDFTANNTFSMKVYSTKANAKVLLKVENSGDAGINYEKEVTMTSVNAWETLTFDYSAIPANTYDKLVIIFDLGTMGDGTANFTYHFDDISLYNDTGAGSTINLPIDFETTPITSDFENFDGATATVIDNPNSGGINTSSKVGQIVRDGGQVWAGSKIVLANNLDFSSMGVISMKVYSPAAGITVKFKLEGTGETEKDSQTTMANQWETLTWDFTGQPANFNTVVFMFDFGNLGDGTAASTFLFDDVMQTGGGMSQIDLPVDFESSTVNYTMTDFGGNIHTVVDDPEDAGNTVVQVVKPVGAATWAGTTIGTASGFATNIPITLVDSKMNVRIWSPDAGTPIRFKLEDSTDDTHTVETEVLTTVAGGWEVLEFDFANEATGTAALSFGLSNGWTYNKASLFFNFGIDGDTAGEKTYYFENVKFGAATLGVNDQEFTGLKIYPNPTQQYWNIESINDEISDIKIFDLLGKTVKSFTPNTLKARLNIAGLSKGIYIARIASEDAVKTVKLIKN